MLDVIDSLENCKYCSSILIRLVNDLMDLAKLENMKFTLNNSYFDLTKTIKDAFETLSYFGNQKSIYPTLYVDPMIQSFVTNLYGD
jgi:signal transduction histidine kinase